MKTNDGDKHVLKMWTPFHENIGKDYRYIHDGKIHNFFSMLLKWFAVMVLTVFNRLLVGFKLEGKENRKKIKATGAVTISNHIHPMDCTMIGCCFPTRLLYYVSLQSNFGIPGIRHLIRLLNAIPLPENRIYLQEFKEAVGEALQKGRLLHIYPESVLIPRYDGFRKFKSGAFHFAYDNDVPVLPIVFYYKKVNGIEKIIHRKPNIHMMVLEPVYPDKTLSRKESVEKLKEDCYSIMCAVYEEKTDIHSH